MSDAGLDNDELTDDDVFDETWVIDHEAHTARAGVRASAKWETS